MIDKGKMDAIKEKEEKDKARLTTAVEEIVNGDDE